MEIWKIVQGYKDKYEVSSEGRVRSAYGILKPQLNRKRRYFYISLEMSGKRKNHILHRLIALTFLPQIEGKNQVNHKDANRANNALCNLEWVTKEENYDHARKMGVYVSKMGEAASNVKLTEKKVLEIIRLRKETGMFHKDIAKKYGIGVSTVTHILLGSRWPHLTHNLPPEGQDLGSE